MSNTVRKEKGPGFEYWSRRPGNRNGAGIPGRFTKRNTHRRERLQARHQIRVELGSLS
jgi:hypothetical protein